MIHHCWKNLSGYDPAPEEINSILALIEIVTFDFAGADAGLVISVMREMVESVDDAAAAAAGLNDVFTELMARRPGVNALGLRGRIGRLVRLKAPPRYHRDVVALRKYSDTTRTHLEHFEETRIGQQRVRIDRPCTAAVLQAIADDLFLIVGDPGAGKSAVISAAAAELRAEGKDVIELAVDRLSVESQEGLQQHLQLTHPVVEVLENWPGNEPAFLFIDALDATRGGRSEAIFRWLLSEVLNLPGKRWRVVASIRSFDLRMGQQLRELFEGRPPIAAFSVNAFSKVKHLHIPVWTDEELTSLLAQSLPLAQAVAAGGSKLFELARSPFNTRLLADLLTTGVQPDAFNQVSTQSQLLNMYWGRRVEIYGMAVELALRRVVAKMVEHRSLQAERFSVGANDPGSVENLLRENVLVQVSNGRYIAFRHHILFDFAASRVYIDARSATELAHVFSAERSVGLMLGPSLIFALNELWQNSELASRRILASYSRLRRTARHRSRDPKHRCPRGVRASSCR